ncbi:MAG: hypothetical protein Q9174_001049 [Haloplaca sp. 1 TL-2023]
MATSPLAGLTIALTGDFGPRRSHHILNKWVEWNGGRSSWMVLSEVTHLVCSKDDFRHRVPIVQAALKLHNIAIVAYDWLEDSILKQLRQDARLEYTMANALAAAKRAKQEKKRARRQALKDKMNSFVREAQELQRILFSDRYHIYHDSTGFIYNITLVLVHLEQNVSERYVLKLCVTHDVPLYFATILTHHPRNTHLPNNVILAPKGSDWTKAFGAFTSYFEILTSVRWDDRLVDHCDDDGAFTYIRPKKGEPVGEMERDWDFGQESWYS